VNQPGLFPKYAVVSDETLEIAKELYEKGYRWWWNSMSGVQIAAAGSSEDLGTEILCTLQNPQNEPDWITRGHIGRGPTMEAAFLNAFEKLSYYNLGKIAKGLR